MVAEGDRTLWQVTKGEGTPRHRSDLVQRGSQAKVLNAGGGASTCASHKLTSPCLLAIPAFDRIAGLCNRHLNPNRVICLR